MSHPKYRQPVRILVVGQLLLAILVTLATSAHANASRIGKWDPPRQWPVIGIHAAVLPTGEVLHLTYLEVEDETGTVASLWNPKTEKFRDASPGFGDMFCSGQNLLPDGRLFVAGGLRPDKCEVQGTRETYLFDPFSRSWSEAPSMGAHRYYPTVLALADGRQLILAGQGDRCQYVPVMEVFEPPSKLQRVQGPRRVMRDYPRAFLLSTGEIAHIAPEPSTAILDPEMTEWTPMARTRLGLRRYEAAGFYVPGREDHLMLCGGYLERSPDLDLSHPTNRCEMIDFSAREPTWREVAPMHEARGDLNAVILPDGKVMVVGGGTHHRYDGPVLTPEIYDPETNTWTRVARQRFGRMYHSTAVLLPDGRVLSAGQDDPGHHGVVSGSRGEIYNPSYLFRGKRPRFRRAPDQVKYGKSFRIKVRNAKRIEKIVLIGLSAVTHATNVGQRYVPLRFKHKRAAKIRVRAPKNPNLAPPGYYMLFVLNEKDVPSEAEIVHLTDPAAPEDSQTSAP